MTAVFIGGAARIQATPASNMQEYTAAGERVPSIILCRIMQERYFCMSERFITVVFIAACIQTDHLILIFT